MVGLGNYVIYNTFAMLGLGNYVIYVVSAMQGSRNDVIYITSAMVSREIKKNIFCETANKSMFLVPKLMIINRRCAIWQ